MSQINIVPYSLHHWDMSLTTHYLLHARQVGCGRWKPLPINDMKESEEVGLKSNILSANIVLKSMAECVYIYTPKKKKKPY